MEEKEDSSNASDANIHTFLRIRPSKASSGYFKIDDINDQALHFYLPENYKPPSDYVNNTKTHYSFQFHGIIPMNSTQDDVFKRVGIEAVQNALDGYNSTIFAYGQTGSGKTFTLTGGQERYSDRGIIPRTLSMIFHEMKNGGDVQYKYYISYMEIYNEQGYDLLNTSTKGGEGRGDGLEALPKVSMLEDEHGNFHIKNLSMHPADSEEEALDLLFIGDTNRAVAETPMNLASSRSHCIFTISIEGRVAGTERVRRSKLHLVDLAGSERVAKTNSSGTVLQQAKYINSSLFYLEMVIVALYERATKGRSHIPYRNSMMTSALRDSLGGNCKTIMIATINPESSHTDESLSTCRFAQRVSMIKNKATINEDIDPSILIGKLKSEMLNLREEIIYLKGEAGEGEALTPQEIEELKVKCRKYCDDTDPNSNLDIGKLTLTKIKDTFAILKNLYLEARSNLITSNPTSHSTSGVIIPRSSLLSSSSSSSAAAAADVISEDSKALVKQIQDLKSSLLQREHEIAILVNMVKKGVSVGDLSSTSSQNQSRSNSANDSNNSNNNSNSNSNNNNNLSSNILTSPKYNRLGSFDNLLDIKDEYGNNNNYGSRENSAGNSGKSHSGLKSLQDQQKEREQAREDLIVKRHLFGVPPPSDKTIFDDAAASFEWFKERCSLNNAMEENRELLKDKINEAKIVGERANSSRNTITYLKNSIESIRKERVLQGITRSESKDSEGKDEDQESPEELTHRKAIEQEKSVYKESFERLRVLKPEIEHIRKLIETSRIKMQSQFDEWYGNLHSRKLYDSESSITSPKVLSSSIINPKANSIRTSVESSSFTMSSNSNGNSSISSRSDIGISGTKSSYRVDIAASKDESVNDDIMAFYQAKEELMKRRGAS